MHAQYLNGACGEVRNIKMTVLPGINASRVDAAMHGEIIADAHSHGMLDKNGQVQQEARRG